MKSSFAPNPAHARLWRGLRVCEFAGDVPIRRVRSWTHVRLLAAKEFGDRLRSGWVIACVVVWLGAIGLTSFLGLLQIGSIGLQGYDRTVMSLLNLVQYLVPLLGLLLGHDLLVGEKEEGTLRLVLANGMSRTRLVLGKFLGGCLVLAVPLILGFCIAGTVIGLSTHDREIGAFLRLAGSGLVLGIVFLALGLAISSFSRTRVQALVVALLAWCVAVFVFDLVALGLMVSTRASAAAQEIEIVCDATHVNTAADIHSDFEQPAAQHTSSAADSRDSSVAWVAANPVDLFRVINLPEQTGLTPAWPAIAGALALWLAGPVFLSGWKLRRTDL